MEFWTTTEDYSDYTDSPSYDMPEIHEMCESSSIQEFHIKVFQTCIFIVVFLLGLLGNCLVIITFALYRRVRIRCMTDVFLLHLAFSDLLLVFTIPLQTADTLTGSWEFGLHPCKVMRGLYAVNSYSGLLLLACISIDRYVVIVKAQTAHRLRRHIQLYSMITALCVWTVSILLSLPEIIFANVDSRGDETGTQCEMYVSIQESWRVKTATRGAQIASICLPFVVMLFCYGRIACALMLGRGSRRQHTLRLMAALVLVFLLFQQPYMVLLSVRTASPAATCDQWARLLLADYTTRSLVYVRTCLDPLLYALVGVRFRNDVKKLFLNMGCWHPERLGSTTDSNSSTLPASPPTTSVTYCHTSILPAAKGPLYARSPTGLHHPQPLVPSQQF